MLGKENIEKQVADNQSRLIRMQKEDLLLSSSQQILKLPEDCTIGKAIGEGDCFFDAVVQGLKQLKPKMNFAVKSLREVCRKHALDKQEIKDKVIKDARNPIYDTIVLPDPSISDDELWNAYLANIEYTAEDIERMETQDPHLYKSLTNLKYGSTLQVPIWGRPNIEGRMICSTYEVKLHIIENLPHAGWPSQLVDGLASRSIDYVDYSEENTIHIINNESSYFKPILKKQILPHCYDTMVSEKKSDSKSVYFQQVYEKDMTDNQMDCERSSTDVEVSHAESTIEAIGGLNHEDRLSSEELQLERSQWSSRVTRSSSISSSCTWHSISSDDKMTANGISLANDEIEKRAIFFVKTFVREFEEELSKLSKEAKPGSKTRKPGKTLAYINSTVNDLAPPGPLRLGLNKMNECISFFSAREHRKDAKRIFATIAFLEDKMRKILVETGLEIFQSFEEQMTKVIDDSWKRGIEKLAMDAVSRAINYISELDKKGEFHISDIMKGVVLGGSKRKHLLAKYSGYQVKDKQSGEILITSELYEKVGIEKREGKTTKYYQLREHGYAEKYGYRLPFVWEVEEWEKVEQKYVVSEISKKRYAHILDEGKKKGLASSILKEINGNDLTKKKDIEELHEEIKTLRIHHQKEGKNTFSFDLGCLPEFFIKREIMLGELKEKLSSKNQEEEMSRMVLINGEYGTGKSELARSYGYNKGEDSNVWTNVIWIDARTYGTLLDSFRSLAERLKIPTKNGQEINADMEVKEQQEREIKSIVKDIYQYFQDVKSLFIFDNASEYQEIEKFLPSHFSDLFFGKEKPYVLITSRSKSWKKEIEKIELDDGFFPEEAIAFIRKILKAKNRSQDCYLVELAQALGYLPLALAQAIAYIKQEKISIIKYLEHYDKAMKESNLDYFKVQGIPPRIIYNFES